MWQGSRAFLFTVVTLTVVMSESLTAASLAPGTSPGARSAPAAHAESDGPSDEESDDDSDEESDDGSDGALAVSNELLVRFDPDADEGERAAARRRARTTLKEGLPALGLELLLIDPGTSLAEAKASLESEPVVLYVELNFYRRAVRIPNDARFGDLWALHNTGQSLFGVTGTPDSDIDAPEAWDVTTGGAAISVAVIDTGLDLSHRDLASNVWTNPGESGAGKETNGRDDDSDGLVDDFRGWDWIDSDNNPRDGNGHGTHVAGTIGARADDGFGVAGVDWSAPLMALRVLDDQGTGTNADVMQAYSYAGGKRARVVNASLGGSGYSRSEYDVIRGLPNVLFVVAAGNSTRNTDQRPEYPCAYDLSNVVCVAASDQHDGLAFFSNYGLTSVDLAAPGTSILSSWPGGGHAYLNGTSMATPHVAGAAALLFSRNPAASTTAVKGALLQSVEHKAGLAGRVATGGRLNVARALGVEPPPPPTSPAAPSPAGPVAARDTTPPRVSLRVRRRERLQRALRRGVRARVSCSEPCRLKLRVLVRSRSTRRLGFVRGRQRTVAGLGLALDNSTKTTVVLRVTPGARRRLARVKRARLLVIVTAKDSAGNAASAQRELVLRR